MRLFSDELSAWRKAANLLQKQAADVLGVPLATFRKWEKGKRTPKKLTLEAVRARIDNYNASRL